MIGLEQYVWMQALAFGMKYQGTYMDSDLDGLKDHGKHYPSTGYIDELAWGNIWVYWATGVSSSSLQPNLCIEPRKSDVSGLVHGHCRVEFAFVSTFFRRVQPQILKMC